MMKECQHPFCIWVKDAYNPDHYVCLKCDRERWLNQVHPLTLVVLILVFVAIMTLLMGCQTDNSESSPQEYYHHLDESTR